MLLDDPLRTALAFASTAAGRRRAHLVQEARARARGKQPALVWSTPVLTNGRWARLTLVQAAEWWLGEYRDSTHFHEVVVYVDEVDALAWSEDVRAVLTDAGWL